MGKTRKKNYGRENMLSPKVLSSIACQIKFVSKSEQQILVAQHMDCETIHDIQSR